MIKRVLWLIVGAVVATAGTSAKTKSPISISTQSYQQVLAKDKKGHVLKDKKGKPKYKWVKAIKVVPGNIVKYVDTVVNSSDKVISDVKVTNAINKNLIFIKKSAKSSAKFNVKYSVDKGNSYDVPSKLFIIGKDKKKYKAKARDYNAIQFSVREVPAHGKVKVEYKAKIK